MIRAWLSALLLTGGLAFAAEKSGGIPDPEAPKPPPATVGTDKEAQPSVPAKGVEEPVFQLPDLVIVGENQARIMAQKEALTGSPLQGLHEAPLLEKEESSIAALRRREPAPVPYPTRTGTGALLRLEGGSGGAFLGGGWIGRQTERRLLGLEFHGARILGEPVGTGYAGGWEAGATFHVAHVSSPGAPVQERPAGTKRLNPLMVGGVAEQGRAAFAFGLSRLDLPRFTGVPGAERSRGSVQASGATSAGGGNLEAAVQVRYASIGATRHDSDALGTAVELSAQLTQWRSVTVVIRPRFEAETADGSGSPSLLGGTVEAAWVPGERIRGVAGITLEGASWTRPGGSRAFSGLASPMGGLAWTFGAGTTVSARFAPGVTVPWVARAAVESPYSVFGTSTIPERTLGDLRVAARMERRDGSHAEVAYRLRESRGAASWWERPGEGLFQPAHVSAATVHEGRLSLRTLRWNPLSVRVEAAWREIVTTGGAIANLPESEGVVSAAYPWKTLTFGADVTIAQARPGSIDGPRLPGYGSLGLRAEWAPLPRIAVLLAASNLGGARIERWAGYPEPRRLVTIGARAAF